MGRRLSRRSFVKETIAAGTGLAAAPILAGAPAAITPRAGPVVISSANGHTVKNGGPRTCVAEVWERLARGEDVVEAIVAGVNIVELDPEDTSVGYGGLPDADGVVQLDAAVMHGPLKRAGAVAALEGVRTPSRVAKAVMDHTDHHLLVGAGAQAFARQMGFAIEADLNTETSRAKWLEWRRRIDPGHWLDPAGRERAAARAREAMIADGLLDRDHVFGTIHCSAIGAKGEIGAATTTSGLAFKIPGRVGDSPILGAGLYVSMDTGAAGSTGRGEANLYQLCSFLIVELMSRGTHPKDACLEALRRVRANTVEKRLLQPDGTPAFDLKFYALDGRGRHAGVAMFRGSGPRYVVCDGNGPRHEPMEALLEGAALP